MRNVKLSTKFTQDRALAVFLNKSARQLTPLVIGQPDQFKKDNFHIVTLTLRLADAKFVACVEVDQNRSFCIQVTDNVVEMQITVRPSCFVIAALNLVDAPQFAGCKDECFTGVPIVTMKQCPQIDSPHFRNDHSPSGTNLDAWPLGIQ